MPPSHRRTLRRGLAATALVAVSPALVSCGFDPQTNRTYQPAIGMSLRESQVDVLGATVVADDTGSGRFVATFVNNAAARPDRVVGISGAGKDTGVQVQASSAIDLAPGGLVNLATDGEPPVLITGPAIRPGYLVNLRYDFARADSVTFQAIVVAPFDQYADLGPGSVSTTFTDPTSPESPSPSPSGSPSASPSESPSASPSEG